MPNMKALSRAQDAPYLNSARNGTTGARDKKTRSVRLPSELWEDIQSVATQLHALFPERYVTVTSTLEFLVREGLRSFSTQKSEDTHS